MSERSEAQGATAPRPPSAAPSGARAARPDSVRTGNKPLASMTSGDLTAAGKEALARICAQAHRRATGGWYAPGKKLSLKVVDQLQARGLARVEYADGRQRLVATGSGKMLNGVFQQRRKGA